MSFRSNRENELLDEMPVKKSAKQESAETGGKIIWRAVNAIMTIFFVMAFGVQFNDPDPFLWVPLYGTAAVLTSGITIQPNFSENKIWRWTYWIHAVFCLGMFFYVLMELVVVATNPQADGSINPLTYEEGREMAGIMITVIWLFTCKQSPTISTETSLKAQKRRSTLAAIIILFSVFPLLLWALCYSNVMSSSYLSLCSDFYMDEFSF